MCAVAEELFKWGVESGMEEGLEKGIEKGLAQGIERGIEQGIEKGLEQGIEKGKLENAKAMARSMYADGLPVDTIAKYANVHPEQITAWLGLH